MDEQHWEKRYRSRARLFSGAPNEVLMTEVRGLPPGQALDVGCGEGADARWLAAQGWQVTAVDLSRTALRQAATAGAGSAGQVAWTHGDPTVHPPPAGAFDLVSLQYFPLRRVPGHRALCGLLHAVAPGGTLLFVSHSPAEVGPQYDGYYQPAEVATLLGNGWRVLTDESRPRSGPPPEGTHHTRDTVLRAVRGHRQRAGGPVIRPARRVLDSDERRTDVGGETDRRAPGVRESGTG
ncbi:class I SAM-dependent methyltransferase [Amycolatopsis jiangsuensis]|uniref:SAM-dependent methyltransferase n=1 Tax=Amycolatopsis jiangsuensis TaxID=1181879 RepID=A0A840IN06_9PSEU|nr:class I SAM-dependent methyltransferase [Amycolatopsis jiangsuensis]MBB4683273.1 SAM-dependent methyltransferase [Amycolatopsis jiangsuensis]